MSDSVRGSILFSAWTAVIVAASIVVMWPVLVVVPAGPAAHRVVRWFCRAVFVLGACRIRVTGLDRLGREPSAVVVANHSSYLDSVVLHASLPRHCRFVVNHVASRRPFLGLIIRKLGYVVVDRGSPQSRGVCARRMVTLLESGESLILFPEGTRSTGRLLPFQDGAFRAAAAANRPVVPIAILGSSKIWPRGTNVLRRGPMEIRVLEPLRAEADDPDAERLRLQAARSIAAALEDP